MQLAAMGKKLPDYAVGSPYSIENRADMLYRVVDRRGYRRRIIADGIDVSTARMLVRQAAPKPTLRKRRSQGRP